MAGTSLSMSALSSLTCGEEPSLTILVLFTFHFLTRYVMICTNDLLIIIGSIIKQLIESKSIVGDMWDVCSLMLGENLSTSSESGSCQNYSETRHWKPFGLVWPSPIPRLLQDVQRPDPHNEGDQRVPFSELVQLTLISGSGPQHAPLPHLCLPPIHRLCLCWMGNLSFWKGIKEIGSPFQVILGPYHFKFSTLMSTSECLFRSVTT